MDPQLPLDDSVSERFKQMQEDEYYRRNHSLIDWDHRTVHPEWSIHARVAKLLEVPYVPQHLPDGSTNPNWLKARKNKLTCSDVASTLPSTDPYHNPHCSRDALFRKRTGRIYGTEDPSKKNCWFMSYGNQHESEARYHFERASGRKVFAFGCITHPQHDWLAGSADGVADDGNLVEFKCPPKRKIEHEVPSYYVPQIQCLMEILDLEGCYFVQYKPASVFNDRILDIVFVERDREWFLDRVETMRSFWTSVEGFLELARLAEHMAATVLQRRWRARRYGLGFRNYQALRDWRGFVMEWAHREIVAPAEAAFRNRQQRQIKNKRNDVNLFAEDDKVHAKKKAGGNLFESM